MGSWCHLCCFNINILHVLSQKWLQLSYLSNLPILNVLCSTLTVLISFCSFMFFISQVNRYLNFFKIHHSLNVIFFLIIVNWRNILKSFFIIIALIFFGWYCSLFRSKCEFFSFLIYFLVSLSDLTFLRLRG